MKSKIALAVSVGFAILFGSLAYVYYEKAYVAEAGMQSSIQDMLRDSGLFFKNDQYDAAYVEPLYRLNGYAELQYSYLMKDKNSDLVFIARVVKEYADPERYQTLSTDEKGKIADYLWKLAEEQPIHVDKDVQSFFYELGIKQPSENAQ